MPLGTSELVWFCHKEGARMPSGATVVQTDNFRLHNLEIGAGMSIAQLLWPWPSLRNIIIIHIAHTRAAN